MKSAQTSVIIIFFLFIPFATSAQQQDVTFEHYSIDEGLSNHVVRSIVQDRLGFIWIGTEDGLNRFDGYSFKVYKHTPHDSSSLASSAIMSLCSDSSGNLWISTGSGLDRYDPTKDNFIHLDHQGIFPFVGNVNISSVVADRNDNLWINTQNNGVIFCDQTQMKVKHLHHDPSDPRSLPSDTISNICVDSKGRVWFCFPSVGLSMYNPATGMYITHRSQSGDAGEETTWEVTAMGEDRAGNIWLSTFGHGIICFSESTGHSTQFHHDPHNSNSLADETDPSLVVDSRGRIWIGNYTVGVDCYDPASQTFSHYPYDPRNPLSIGSERIYTIYEDRTGSLWFGTWRGGLSVYHPRQRKFSLLRHIPGEINSLNGDTVWAECEDRNGRLWIGTEGDGLDCYDFHTRTFAHYRHNDRDNRSITDNFVIALKEDHAGQLWIATYGGGLDRFDQRNGAFVHYRHDQHDTMSLSSDRLTSLFEDSHGQLWIGTTDGVLNKFDASAGKFFRYEPGDSRQPSYPHNEIESIIEDSTGTFWVGTFGSGLFRFNPDSHSFQSCYRPPGNPHNLPYDGIYCLALDEHDDLWIGTFAGGLFRYDRSSDSFQQYTEADGLASNYIKGIVADGKGNLWLSSIRGLTRFDMKDRVCRNYDMTDGVQANEFRTGSFYRARSGLVCFGGVKGLNIFHPDSIRDNLVAPPIVITSFKVFDEPIRLDRPISDIDEVRLSYSQNFFSCEFVALNYAASQKNRYAYKLDGFDKNWVMAGMRRFANYTHLDGGEYIFRVKGCNNDGIWNEMGVSLRVIIQPPFWATWWFRAILILLIAGVPFLIYRARFRRILEIERTRSRIARDLHDELSATLSGINFFTQAISRDQENKVSQNSQRFLSLIHESAAALQDSISDIIWSVNPGEDHWDHIVAKFRRYASDLFDSKSIRYRFDFPVEIPSKPIAMERRRNVWLIYKEIVTNTAKHSQSTSATIALRFRSDREAELEIGDDGIGFDPGITTRGNGLKNIRARAHSIGAEVRVESQQGKGTHWILRFPV